MDGDVNATITDEVEDNGFEILDDELDFMNYFYDENGFVRV